MQIVDQLANVPEELKKIRQWVYHKEKVPYNPKTNTLAKPNSIKTSTSFEKAIEHFDSAKYDGLGLILADNGLVGIDIDKCIDPQTGICEPYALKIVQKLDSYTEVSPSGLGLHIFAFGDIEKTLKKKEIEMYKSGRYLTVTGQVFGEPKPVEYRADEVSEVYKQYSSSKKKQAESAVTSEDETDEFDDAVVLAAAKQAKNSNKFELLMDGDEFGLYPSKSDADMAFCNLLAFWTRRNPTQMDRIFRLSGLMRDKWDEFRGSKTYGQITIEKAIAGCETAFGEVSINLKEIPSYQAYSVAELLNKEIPPIQWVVENLIPEGLTILAAPPKAGKSWWALDLGMSVVRGLPFLERQTIKGNVLYIALEDSERRIQKRTKQLMLLGGDNPYGLKCVHFIEPIGLGFEQRLELLVKQSEPTLIIIDTLEKVRGIGGSKDMYKQDYKDAGLIKELAEKYKTAIVVIHHTRKSKDNDDPFAQISGSFGLLGAADSAMVIDKPKRNDTQATLYITGRDVDRQELAIEFNTEQNKWLFMFEDQTENRRKEEYCKNPIIITIKDLTAFGSWSGTTAELNEKIQEITSITYNTKELGKLIVRLISDLLEFDNISYNHKNHSGLVKHIFTFDEDDISNYL
jgi:Uncharacterized conserved protein